MSQLNLLTGMNEQPAKGFGGVDDMNMVEVILGLPGSRQPAKGEVCSVPWEPGERSYHLEYSRTYLRIAWKSNGKTMPRGKQFYIEVNTSENKGLPTRLAEDVLVALLKMTADDGFDSPIVRTTRYSMLKLMQWHTGGDYYERLELILSQLTHMTVSTNALWSPATETYGKGEFNILDNWKIDGAGDRAGPETPLEIEWGSRIFEVFGRNYMKQLDTETYYGLSNANTKRIYRWLDKHLSLYPVVKIDVLRFAHKVLGYGASYKYPSQIIQKLEPRFKELSDIGFCYWEVDESTSDSGKQFIFSRLTDFTSVTLPRRDNIISALESHGVTYPERLVDEYNWNRCLRQLAYLEWRLSHVKPIEDTGAWLADAIRKDHTLPAILDAQLRDATKKTAEWCDAMFDALTTSERERVESQVDELMKHEKVAESEALNHRRKLRNRLLLARSKQM